MAYVSMDVNVDVNGYYQVTQEQITDPDDPMYSPFSTPETVVVRYVGPAPAPTDPNTNAE